MRLKELFVTFAVVWLCTSVATGSIVFRDDFNSPNGNLVGTTPDVGVGTWSQTGADGTNPIQISGSAARVNNAGQDAYAQFASPVTPTNGASIYSGFDINLSTNGINESTFHLTDTVGATLTFYQLLFSRNLSTGYQFGLSTRSGSFVAYGTTVLNRNTTYHVVIAWDFLAGGGTNDLMKLYINPTNATEGANSIYAQTSTWGSFEPTSLVAANLRQGALGPSPTGTIDNLVVATTFAEAAGLTIVPEASAFLFGLVITAAGVVGIQFRRSRACV